MPVTIIPGTMKYKKNGVFNELDCIKGEPGSQGNPGFSPGITVTDITGGHRVTITDESGPHSFDVMNGADATAPVQDVQVNGTSALDAQGVANIPYATASEYGLIKRGRGLFVDNTTGALVVDFGDSGQIKQGTNTNAVMSIFKQHESAFYGLAKVAGSDLANETVNLGEYPDAAKVAIQKMLGVYEAPWELIREITTTQDETEIVINTDSYGEPLELTELILDFECGQPTTGTKDMFYGQFSLKNHNTDSTSTTSFPSIQYPSATSTIYAKVHIATNYGAPVETKVVTAQSDGNSVNVTEMVKMFLADSITSVRVYQAGSTKSLIPSGAVAKLYGRRKAN